MERNDMRFKWSSSVAATIIALSVGIPGVALANDSAEPDDANDGNKTSPSGETLDTTTESAVDESFVVPEELLSTPFVIDAPATPAAETEAAAGDESAPAEVSAVQAEVVTDGNAAADQAPTTTAEPEITATGATDSQVLPAHVINERGSYSYFGVVGPVYVNTTEDVQITFSDVTIDASERNVSALTLIKGAKVTLTIKGSCVLTGAAGHAGIEVPEGSSIAIVGDVAECSLTAIGNAGDDTYNGNANGAAGIGGDRAHGSAGAISIDGTNRNLTLSAVGGGMHAAGIGSCDGNVESIVIHNAVLSHIIGGGQGGPFDVGYGKNVYEGGAAIGTGGSGKALGGILISGCVGTDIVGGGKSAGIGSSFWSSKAGSVSIRIEDSELEVKGGMTGAAIGLGRMNDSSSADEAPLDLVIVNSTVHAEGGVYGAGIGLGINGSNYDFGVSNIQIKDSTIDAWGGAGAAGIGAGVRGTNVNISILGDSVVHAYAGALYTSDYSVLFNPAGVGQAGAAAIGRGAWGSVDFANGAGRNYIESKTSRTLAIDETATVFAFSSGDNWAIAGFNEFEGNAAVLQARFVRNYALDAIFKDKEWYYPQGFDTQASDSADGSQAALMLDASAPTTLRVTDADGNVLYYVDLPGADASFLNGFSHGSARAGYYAFAVTVPGEGSYRIATEDDLRELETLGAGSVSYGDEGYLGGATYLGKVGESAYLKDVDAPDNNNDSELFEVGLGLNNFDRVAFRRAAVDEPKQADPEPEPVPDPTPEPDPEPVPDPEPDPEPDPAPTPDPTPEPAPVVTITPDATPAAGPAAPGAPAAPEAPFTSARPIFDDIVPMATTSINDDANPLAGLEDDDLFCWVHPYIILGILATGVYSLLVLARRKRNSDKHQDFDDRVMGKKREQTYVTVPAGTVVAPAAMAVKEG